MLDVIFVLLTLVSLGVMVLFALGCGQMLEARQ
jgi:hypothetical protein